MGPYANIAMILALGSAVSCWNLRLERVCEAGNPLGTNHTLVEADTFLGCASACDFNTNCYYISFHGTKCVMYEDASPCGTGVGTTRDVYKVEPQCEPGWHRFDGSCYFVVPSPAIWAMFYYLECPNRGAHIGAIRSERESTFLKELLHSHGMYNTTIWTGGQFSNGKWGWTNSPESMVYQNWKDGEPQGIEYCMSMNSTDGKWQSDSCGGEARSGICEKLLF